MTGKEIYSTIIKPEFYSLGMIFSIENRLELKSKEEALNFLTLYCVLLSTTQIVNYNEEQVEKNYKEIHKKLVENLKIRSTEFLKNPEEKNIYILRENLCLCFGIN